ncbi:protein tweety isoform X1 [Diorhabda carinulata]|uniref:protein tweety isoform X1 n=1 Tax=Diorhabda carinulata TaxID=1163345 RepID=UPI0025A1CF80|nr:protein tweety isoform X1 [Diorhabda carinulata]XP_057657301.1 protein tweety isoform X1 [Diorhabda carinulata]
MGMQSTEDSYRYPEIARYLHALPHVNVSFQYVNSSFEPNNPVYLESLGILGSIPAIWLILTLFVLLIYLLTRCCDRKPRASKSIAALKVTLAVVSVLCCAGIGIGLYGNDDLHNGIVQTLNEGKQVDILISTIRNQTEVIESLLRIQADRQIKEISNVYQGHHKDKNLFDEVDGYFKKVISNRNATANAARDIRSPLVGVNLSSTISIGEKSESIRWLLTMGILSVLLILCVILLVGVARHNRCALIAFSVCGLLAVIASYIMASVYLASSVALSDLCMAPDKFIEDQASTELSKEILRHYTNCERARANPFTQRLREAKTTVENMRSNLTAMIKPAEKLFPDKKLDIKFSALRNDINSVDNNIHSLTALVDCSTLYLHYLGGVRALCYVGLLGLTLMLISSAVAGFLLTVLVWVDSHTWIYIRKKKDYQQVTEHDSYLPPPQASQAIAARTLQRSQGSSYPPDTPPPSYTSALLLHNRSLHVNATAPPQEHEADFLLDGCDMRPSEHHRNSAHMSHLRGHTLGRLPSHHHEPVLPGPNNGKYATLSKQCKTLESSDFY